MASMTSPPVAIFNFTIKQGSDLTVSMVWSDDTGAPINLTGYSMKMAILATPTSTTPLLTLSSTSTTGSRIALGTTDGTISLIFARADTAAMKLSGTPMPNPFLGGLPSYQLGVYDLQFVDASGNVGYLLEGTVYLEPRATS